MYKIHKFYLVAIVSFLFSSATFAFQNSVYVFSNQPVAKSDLKALTPKKSESFERWLLFERNLAERKILNNISPENTLAGAVIASPSKHDPNYFYNWVRDAALTMDVWMRQLEGSPRLRSLSVVESLMWDYFYFTEYSQRTPMLVGLGEPRYNVDGTANLDPWGRPQNDGPALRASVLIRFAKYLLAHNKAQIVRERIWPVILNDLNYVSYNIHQPSVDLWEEVKGDHFYTRMTMRAALKSGADFARTLGEASTSIWFSSQADVVSDLMQAHFRAKADQIVENLNRQEGVYYKNSGLDVATLLAVLHTREYPALELNNPLLVSTLNKMERSFHSIYNINLNKMTPTLGTAIGRYPEDTYYGGNPWFLSTLAFAEYNYLIGNLEAGDTYMRRVQYHMNAHGEMSEQISRENGYMLSADNLTWSYAAFLTALEARNKLKIANKK